MQTEGLFFIIQSDIMRLIGGDSNKRGNQKGVRGGLRGIPSGIQEVVPAGASSGID